MGSASSPPSVWVDRLQFSDGTSIKLAQDDIVVIVGPNNAGKSAALRGIRDLLQMKSAKNPVINELSIVKVGEHDDVVAWLDTFTVRKDANPDNPSFQALQSGLQTSEVKRLWDLKECWLGHLSRFFCYMLTTDERLTSSKPTRNIAIAHDPPLHPLHFLLRDDALEKKLSDQFTKAFKTELILQRGGGADVELLTGARPIPAPGQDRISYSYLVELDALTKLQDQGDGMRCFASRPIQYGVEPGGYTLFSYGRDGKAGGSGLDADLHAGIIDHQNEHPTFWQFTFDLPTEGIQEACLLAGMFAFPLCFIANLGVRGKRSFVVVLITNALTAVFAIWTAVVISALHLPSGH